MFRPSGAHSTSEKCPCWNTSRYFLFYCTPLSSSIHSARFGGLKSAPHKWCDYSFQWEIELKVTITRALILSAVTAKAEQILPQYTCLALNLEVFSFLMPLFSISFICQPLVLLPSLLSGLLLVTGASGVLATAQTKPCQVQPHCWLTGLSVQKQLGILIHQPKVDKQIFLCVPASLYPTDELH